MGYIEFLGKGTHSNPDGKLRSFVENVFPLDDNEVFH